MVLIKTRESGAEEWMCPSCGRRVLFRWPPNYEKLVLDHGDESATHAGGKGGVRVDQVMVKPVDMRDLEPLEHDWLRDHGIDWQGPAA
jgi:hypothetical protein